MFEPSWKSKNQDKAVAAVGKIDDQKLLCDIAQDGRLTSRVREAALDRLQTQVELPLPLQEELSLMAEGRHRDLALTALRCVTDQPLLARIVLASPQELVRQQALDRLTDPVVLRDCLEQELAKSNPIPETIASVCHKLSLAYGGLDRDNALFYEARSVL